MLQYCLLAQIMQLIQLTMIMTTTFQHGLDPENSNNYIHP